MNSMKTKITDVALNNVVIDLNNESNEGSQLILESENNRTLILGYSHGSY